MLVNVSLDDKHSDNTVQLDGDQVGSLSSEHSVSASIMLLPSAQCKLLMAG